MRHHEIEQHETDVGFAFEHLERFATVVGKRDAKRALLELHLDDAADVRFVIGDEHMVRSARSWTRSLRRESRCVPDCDAARRAAGRCSRWAATRTSSIASADSTETIARPVRMLENRGEQLAAIDCAPPNSSAEAMIAGTARGDIFGVETGSDLAVDEQAIVAEHDGGVHSFALSDGRDQISNARQACDSPAKWWRS